MGTETKNKNKNQIERKLPAQHTKKIVHISILHFEQEPLTKCYQEVISSKQWAWAYMTVLHTALI